MKELPDMTMVPDKLFDLQYGVVKGQILMTAVDLKIFNHTAEPATSEDVAGAIGSLPGYDF